MKAPSRGKALAALLLVTLIWGFSFVWMKQNLSAAERVLGRPAGLFVIAAYTAARFAIATAFLVFWPTARRNLTRGAWNAGFILGVILAGGFFLQILGLQTITPAQLEGSESREVEIRFPNGYGYRFTGLDYLTRFMLPNFFFHVQTAYAILRAQGVDVGKQDYLAHMGMPNIVPAETA